jgi:hypothetical protein
MFLKAAVYLVGHGPYREPRLLELQYLRIQRYRVALANKLNKNIAIKDVYIDINSPRDTTADNLRNLMVLIDKINHNLYDMVLIDIEDSINQVHLISPVINTLEHTGVKVYNCYYDDEDALKNEFVRDYGEGAARVANTSDDEDIITLFPALVGSIIFRAFERELDSLNNCYEGDFNQVYRKARRLSTTNPYGRGSFPRLSVRQTRDLRKIQEKECELRRQSEPLYYLSPDCNGKLFDEGVFNGTRDKEDLIWAEERLENLGFIKTSTENKISYQRNFQDCVIFADPRGKKRLEFDIYRTNITKHRKPRTITKNLGYFSIPDAWKNGLKQKFENKVLEIIKGKK